jgi:hypothetical protein
MKKTKRLKRRGAEYEPAVGAQDGWTTNTMDLDREDEPRVAEPSESGKFVGSGLCADDPSLAAGKAK